MRAVSAVLWLLPSLSLLVSAEVHAQRRRPSDPPQPPRPTSSLIADAVSRGRIDRETALLYQVFAAFGDCRLPKEFASEVPERPVDTIFYALRARMPHLSPEKRELLEPYLRDPDEPGSWFEQLETLCGGARSRAGANKLEKAPRDLRIVTSPQRLVAVRYDRAREGHATPQFAMAVQDLVNHVEQLIWPRLFAAFGADPVRLGNEPLLITLLHSERLSPKIPALYDPELLCSESGPVAAPSPGKILVNLNHEKNVSWVTSRESRDFLLHNVAHELAHAFWHAFAFRNCGDLWLLEAVAEWSARHALLPEIDRGWGQEYLRFFLPKMHERLAYIPLFGEVDAEVAARAYGAWIFILFLEKNYGGPAIVNRIVRALERNENPLAALDAALGGKFAEAWHKFALAAVNEAPYDQFQEWDEFTDRPPFREYHLLRDSDNPLFQQTGEPRQQLPVTLPAASIQYHRFRFDEADRAIAFINGVTFAAHLREITIALGEDAFSASEDAMAYAAEVLMDSVPVKVQVLVRKRGQQEWIDKSSTQERFFVFCRDKSEEDVTDVLVVLSNADQNREAVWAMPGTIGPRVRTSDIGCWKWTGESKKYVELSADIKVTDHATGVTWVREAPGDAVRIINPDGLPHNLTEYLWGYYYKPSGGTVTSQGKFQSPIVIDVCTGVVDKTASIDRRKSYLLTFNFVAGGEALRSHRGHGEGMEFPIPLQCIVTGNLQSEYSAVWLDTTQVNPLPAVGADGALAASYDNSFGTWIANGHWRFTPVRE